MKYNKIPLPYSFDALEPYIDKETVEIHYTKHLQGYVDKLNSTLEGYDKFTKGKTLEEVLACVNKIPSSIKQDVINYGGGVSNHNLYFSILSPTPQKRPKGKLLNEINRTFGDIEWVIEELNKIAIEQFGSGYAWLVKDRHGKLCITKTLNQDTPLSIGYTPILTIDIWEHAYYLKYKNLRAEYLKNIWNVVDWGKVEELYNKHN